LESDVTTRAGWGGVELCFGWLKLEQRTSARGLPRRARFGTQNEGREDMVSHEIFLRRGILIGVESMHTVSGTSKTRISSGFERAEDVA
jgi:hypothetical protein